MPCRGMAREEKDKDILDALEKLRHSTDGLATRSDSQPIINALKAHGELVAVVTEKQIEATKKLEESSKRLEDFTTLLIVLTFLLLGVTIAFPLLEEAAGSPSPLSLFRAGLAIVILVLFLYFGRKIPSLLRAGHEKSNRGDTAPAPTSAPASPPAPAARTGRTTTGRAQTPRNWRNVRLVLFITLCALWIALFVLGVWIIYKGGDIISEAKSLSEVNALSADGVGWGIIGVGAAFAILGVTQFLSTIQSWVLGNKLDEFERKLGNHHANTQS